jgi:O-succinylbenzoate synthase
MSTQTQSNDAFTTYKQNVQKYFENISKITPQYFQSITYLQEECFKACEKKEFAKKTGISTEIPSAAKSAIVDANKQIVQASTVQNQFVKTTIDTTVQNMKTFNDNVNAFVELNKNIIQSWVNPFTQKSHG